MSVASDLVEEEPADEEPLIFESNGRLQIRCPWCEIWGPEEAYTELQTPPHYPEQCGVVLKHGGDGCKSIFSIRNYQRPAKAVE